MRAREFCESEGLDRHRPTARRPIISLRHINKLKRMKSAHRDEYAQRLALLSLMYGQDDIAQKEMDQCEAKLDRREGEVRMKELQADIEKSINDAEVDQKARNRLHQLAMAALHRRQKSSSQHEQPAKPALVTETTTGQGSIARVADRAAAPQVRRTIDE